MTNFWDALEQVNEIAENKEFEYRLYYDIDGQPIFYTTETDKEGNWIQVDEQTYKEGRYDVTVVDGKLVNPSKMIYKKLAPVDNGGTSTVKWDISILGDGQDWEVRYYE